MKVFFIVNAQRGKRPPSPTLLKSFDQILESAGGGHRIAQSESIDHAKSLCDEAISGGYDTLWIGGGDGTINVLLNYTFGSGLTYGVVPMGTINALARSFGIPLSPEAAARYLVKAKPTPMDVGQVNDAYFVCFASVGFDAGVVHEVTSELKRRCGRFAYVLKGFEAVLGMRRLTRFEVDIDGSGKQCERAGVCEVKPHVETGHSFVLSNICNYAGFRMFHQVQPCSGDMELFLFRHNRILTILGWAAASIVGNRRLIGCVPTVGHYMVPAFTVRSEKPMFLQIDGEAVSLGSNHEYRFRCLENAITLLV